MEPTDFYYFVLPLAGLIGFLVRARDENKLKSSMKNVEVIEYAIKRRQHSLEQRKKKSNTQVYDNGKIH